MAITPSQWSHKLWIPDAYIPGANQSGIPLVVTEAVIAKMSPADQDTFWNNVQNGGGDVRFCVNEDGTSQLPVEIPSDNLDNQARTCVIWARRPYSGASGVWCFIGKAGETQPAVTDPFGRNAVWVDYELIIHEGQVVDSTGNHSPVLNGSPSLATGLFGQGYDLQLGEQYIKIPDSPAITFAGKSYSVDIWSNVSALSGPAQMLLDKSYTGNDSEVRLFKQNGGNTRHRLPSLTPSNFDTADSYGLVRDSFVFASGVRRTLSNNSQTGSDTPSGSISSSTDDLTIGSDRKDEGEGGALPLVGVISEVWLQFDTIRSDSARSTEYANQNDPTTFYGTPTIATTGGGAVTADALYTINAPTFAGSADASLPQPIANTAFTLNTPAFSANATATIPGFSASVVYSVNAPTFAADAAVTLPQPTADVTYTVAAPTFSVDSTATLPQPTANATFSLPAPTFAASATVTQTGFNASVNFTLPAPTFSASATATLPQPIADGNFTITAPTFSVVAIAGGIAIIVDNETNINMPALSTNINAPVLSNNVRI